MRISIIQKQHSGWVRRAAQLMSSSGSSSESIKAAAWLPTTALLFTGPFKTNMLAFPKQTFHAVNKAY